MPEEEFGAHRAILVARVPRGGIAAVTQIVGLLGATLPRETTAPLPEKEAGSFGPEPIVRLHDQILTSLGTAWDDPSPLPRSWFDSDLARGYEERLISLLAEEYSDADLFALDDPRICRLVPLWLSVLDQIGAEPSFLIPIGNPLDVAESLGECEGYGAGLSLLLWLKYLIEAERETRSQTRSFLSHEGLLADWRGELERLSRDLSLPLPGEFERASEIKELLSGLQRPRAFDRSELEAHPDVVEWVAAAYEAGLQATRGGKVDVETFDSIAVEFDRARGAFGPALAETRGRLTERASRAEKDARGARAEAEAQAREIRRLRGKLQTERAAALAHELRDLEKHVDAIARSQAWRFGHGVVRVGRRLMLDPIREPGSAVSGARDQMRTIKSLAKEIDAAPNAEAVLPALARELHALERQLEHIGRSEAWRLGHRVVRVARRASLRKVERTDGVVGGARRRARRSKRLVTQMEDVATPRMTLPDGSRTRSEGGKSLKVSLICWDMGHNPITRANLLAEMLDTSFEVEIVGSQFPRFGDDIWAPLRDSRLSMRTFPGGDFPKYFETMKRAAASIDGDVIYACKPRLPSLGIALLAKELRNRPLLLDSDDLELSFFDERRALGMEDLRRLQDDPDFKVPFGRIWTRYCDSIVRGADHLTVSNPALRDRFGGTVVPHARDEQVFDPRLYDRREVRASLGFEDREKVVLFAGTPRAHKGIQAVAEALEAIGNPNYKLCVIGTVADKYLREQLERFGDWIRLIPYQPFSKMARILTAADLMCVLQDPESLISQYQVPAKVTDAIAMEIPCLVTRTPPLEHFISNEAVHVLDEQPLDETIKGLLEDYDETKAQAVRSRELFLSDYSYAAVRPRIETAIRSLVDAPPPLAPEHEQLLRFARDAFAAGDGARGDAGTRAGAAGGGDGEDESLERRPRRAAVESPSGEPFDLVVFWKQNDTGIYGRRQDMLVDALARSERVHRIIHFDRPLSVSDLNGLRNAGGRHHQGTMVYRQTLARAARLKSRGKVRHYTFLFRPQKRPARTYARAVGRLFPARERYRDFVARTLRRNAVGRRPTVFWVYPTDEAFPEITDALRPDVVVADVVDDQRTWVEPGSERYRRLTENYAEILGRSDIVLTNCEPVRQAMRPFADDIELVPNASEAPSEAPPGPPPRDLRELPRPIIGYVGNLSSRIDLHLLERLAKERPNWSLVFIGSTHLGGEILRLSRHSNVHFLGVKRHAEAKRYIRAFDVGIIPHLDNAMTQAMHPLKAFVYSAQGVPVVSTSVANLDELGGLVRVAGSRTEFIAAIEAALAEGKCTGFSARAAEALAGHTWDDRARQVLELLDARTGWTESRNGVATSPANAAEEKENVAAPPSSAAREAGELVPTPPSASQEGDLAATPSAVQESDEQSPGSHPPHPSARLARLLAGYGAPDPAVAEAELVEGLCSVCGEHGNFPRASNSIREGFKCQVCDGSFRYRHQACVLIGLYSREGARHFAELVREPAFRGLDVYEPGVIGPFRRLFRDHPSYINSYYWPEVPSGGARNGVRCEDLQALTFADQSFDLVITSDIFEHVRRPDEAFDEVRRVLRPGGCHVFTIPVRWPWLEKSVARVDTWTDDDLTILPPVYHGSPTSDEGSLVYTDFGVDLLERLDEIGTPTTIVPGLEENMTFVSWRREPEPTASAPP